MSRRILCINYGSTSSKTALFAGDEFCKDQSEFDAVGHRIVHGGPHLFNPTKIDEEVIQTLKESIHFAPLHLPKAIEAIEKYRAYPQVACFDTGIHQHLPPRAKYFPLPRSLREKGIHRYGFHGLSFESILDQLGSIPPKMIIAHLGGGCSIAAFEKGKVIDTSMGLTPLGGLMMGTRPGDLDPGVILHLENADHTLEHESGLKGVSGESGDLRQLIESESLESNEAIEMFTYILTKGIGSYIAALGGLDLLVFTGGIGENCSQIRDAVAEQIAYIAPKVITIPSDEDRMIAKHTMKVLYGGT